MNLVKVKKCFERTFAYAVESLKMTKCTVKYHTEFKSSIEQVIQNQSFC